MPYVSKKRRKKRGRSMNQNWQNIGLAALAVLVLAALAFALIPRTANIDPAEVAAYESARAAANEARQAEADAAAKKAKAKADKATLAAAFKDADLDGKRSVTALLDGEPVRLDKPTSGSAVGVAIYFHGQGGSVNDRMNTAWLNALRAEGWAVASSTFHGNHWGSEEAVAHAANLAKWAEDEAGTDTRLFIGASMGGLASLNALTHGQEMACWYGTMPVLDPATTRNVPGAEAEIRKVWGHSVPNEWVPAKSLNKLPADTLYRVLTSPDDTLIPAEKNGMLLTVANGLTVSTLTVSGQHGDGTHFNPDDIAAFARNCT